MSLSANDLSSVAWDSVPKILQRITAPHFPNRDFNITHYGAMNDGATDCRPAIVQAIVDCHRSGGGRVIIPAGVHLINGSIVFKSGVHIHLDEKAILRFGFRPEDYLPPVLVRWEGVRCFAPSPLFYAFEAEDIALTGAGIIDAQTTKFWYNWRTVQMPDKELLRRMGQQGVPLETRIFGEGHVLRPDVFQPYKCRNILVDGPTFLESSFWTIHPVFCQNVIVRNIRVAPGKTWNDDGVDPDSCRDVLIEDCTFETMDDGIAIKAGRDQDAWGDLPCENIIIRNCTSLTGVNAFAIGSEMAGGVRNVFIENCRAVSVGSAFNVKTNTDRGGFVENVWVRNLSVERCLQCVALEADYNKVADHPHPSRQENIHVENVICKEAQNNGIFISGAAALPTSNIFLKDIKIERAGTAQKIQNAVQIHMERVNVNGVLLSGHLPEGLKKVLSPPLTGPV